MNRKSTFLALLFVCALLNLQGQQVKKIALSFDADLTESMRDRSNSGEVFYNPETIKILQREKVPCTIFLTGLWAIRYNGIVDFLQKDTLFEFGNHTYSHKVFKSSLNKKIKLQEIENGNRIIELTTKRKINLFRFPGGICSPEDIDLVENLGQKVIHWDISSGDAFCHNEKDIFNNVKRGAKNNAIIVFHLGGTKNAPKTAEALELIIPWLKDQGYQFVKVSEIINASH